MRVENWIFKDNTTALLSELERLAGDDLDQGDVIYLLDAIAGTDGDAEPERWASHDFEGSRMIHAQFAIDQGSSVLRIKLDADDDIAREAEVLISVMQSYELHPRYPPRRA